MEFFLLGSGKSTFLSIDMSLLTFGANNNDTNNYYCFLLFVVRVSLDMVGC